MLSDADVLEYQQLFKQKFGVSISIEESRKRANNLVSLLQTLIQPKRPDQAYLPTQPSSKAITAN